MKVKRNETERRNESESRNETKMYNYPAIVNKRFNKKYVRTFQSNKKEGYYEI